MVATGEKARACRRTKRCGMPLREPHSVCRDSVYIRGLDRTPVAAHRRKPDVVEHDVQNIRRIGWRPRRLERRPVRLRVANVDVDLTFESHWHDVLLQILTLELGTLISEVPYTEAVTSVPARGEWPTAERPSTRNSPHHPDRVTSPRQATQHGSFGLACVFAWLERDQR
jgi:hypothetical protein